MYMADWHGTAVAVRVIDKKATPREDQRLIKEEVLLLHKHHHPNLLMLMGYCETRNELLVVTEFMEGGTLADYLRREKRSVDMYSLVAMAFDVLKGIAYLHSCKPPIVHGSISTYSLLMDAKGTVKVSDFWFSNKRGAFSSSGSGRKLKRAAWQPPEIIAGTFLTPATDVYAFGIVLWELVAPLEMTMASTSSASASCSQSPAIISGVPAACANVTDIVVGQSAGITLNWQGAAEGLRIAIAKAALLTTLPIRLVQYNHSSEAELLANVKKLVEEDCAFLIAATTPQSETEPALLATLRAYGVPLVGPMSASESLRDIANNTATFTRNHTGTAEEVTLPFVVNIRASGSDELNAVLKVVSGQWEDLSRLALVAHDSAYGQWVFDSVDSSLKVLTGSSGVMSSAFLPSTEMADSALESAMAALFATSTPKAIIVSTMPNTTAQVIEWLAHSSHSSIRVYAISWVSSTDLRSSLNTTTNALLDSQGIEIFLTNSMPNPTPSSRKTAAPLVRKFGDAGSMFNSRATLEGYLTGWFIYEVLQRSAARYSASVTRGDFLYAIFEGMRTFDVQGVTLGPYGDGGTDSTSRQTADDACNQGVHEVYVMPYNPPRGGRKAQTSETTLKFAGCMAPQWTSGGVLTLLGAVYLADAPEDSDTRSGLLGAVNCHNYKDSHIVLLRSIEGNSSSVHESLSASKVIAVAAPFLAKQTYATDIFGDVALVSPMPGYWKIVSLFPSAYDETVAAFKFFQSLNATRVAVVINDNTQHTLQCIEGLQHADTGDDTSFQSFFVGKFLSQVIDVAKGTDSNKSLTVSNIVDAVYDRSVFTIEGVQIGPFEDSCSSSSRACCNQGLDTVYVLSGSSVVQAFSVGDCGRDYLPADSEAAVTNTSLILGLAIGLGGVAIPAMLAFSFAVWRTRRTVEFFNIRKTEIELGQCLGHGRFGSMYMADWHGTAVAVRVIDKKATPREDQRLIKEEVLLLHKHHHPNLLMLMGYCETKADLLVVTEYMEGGTLADYLRREKRSVDMYSLVAMAFVRSHCTPTN
eukprot:m51a1_g8799 putative pas domain-containing protein tyrosine kinase (1036) ;mRNA; r:248354-253665